MGEGRLCDLRRSAPSQLPELRVLCTRCTIRGLQTSPHRRASVSRLRPSFKQAMIKEETRTISGGGGNLLVYYLSRFTTSLEDRRALSERKQISRITLGTICGLGFGAIDIGIMLPMSFADKRAAITAALVARLGIGVVIRCGPFAGHLIAVAGERAVRWHLAKPRFDRRRDQATPCASGHLVDQVFGQARLDRGLTQCFRAMLGWREATGMNKRRAGSGKRPLVGWLSLTEP
jgi:hypothetical protein